MALTKLSNATFIDLKSLSFADFRDMDSAPKAVIHFVGGGTETLSGEVTSLLYERLSHLVDATTEGRQTSPQIEIHELNNAPSPSISRSKSWFYRVDRTTGRAFFMAFINAKGSCSLRAFDATTGIAFPKQYRAGNYQDQFKDLIDGAIEVTVALQPNLERDCKQRLPDEILAQLGKQVSQESN